jgi:pimeloyl-ACP methyl ester carboxylesterase
LAGVDLNVAAFRAREFLLTVAVTATGRVCLLRDQLLRRIPWNGRSETAGAGSSRHSIPSGKRRIDAVLVRPESIAPQASVLICHGIGETVEHWHAVQQLLAANGVASLVFDYSGYGRSGGFFSAERAERNAIDSFHFLEKMTAPLPVAVLGLSLGTGIALHLVAKVPLHRLVLCAGFTSLREASGRVGVPRGLQFAVPDIWEAEAALRNCAVPVLIVHGEKDRLFPVRMARELAGFCGPIHELVIHPDVSHNEPFQRPKLSYWGSVVRFLLPDEPLAPSP